jgi:hypothetical protein
MTDRSTTNPYPNLAGDVIVVVGGYGSGKSEISVNLARRFAESGSGPVAIADLDIINPYFRSREAARELQALGIRSLIPPGEQVYADLPIIIPEIKTAIEKRNGKLILDVGGDDHGARVLSSLSDAFAGVKYELLLVHNAHRPFTSDVEGTRKLIGRIEAASRLKFTGIIANSHLMDETTTETVLEGLAMANEVSSQTGLPVVFVSATPEILKRIDSGRLGSPSLTLDRSLLKPWERRV